MTKEDIILEDSERQPCEIWTRVMGYFRPISDWNKGKRSEASERVYFSQHKAQEHLNSAPLRS